MKKTYEKPELNVTEFDAEDVIAASTVEVVDDKNEISVNLPFGV